MNEQVKAGEIGWRSRAEWPSHCEIGNPFEGDNTTADRHNTREQAEAVCRMLEREGLGGERIHFPVRTWVEPILPTDENESRVRFVHRLAKMDRAAINHLLQIETVDECAKIGQLADDIGYKALGAECWEHIKRRAA